MKVYELKFRFAQLEFLNIKALSARLHKGDITETFRKAWGLLDIIDTALRKGGKVLIEIPGEPTHELTRELIESPLPDTKEGQN
jgi:hypothetical protein